MIRAIFFDMGGTLDGDGLHWLDRFVALYARAGLSFPRETIRAAFDFAERCTAADTAIMSARLDDMIDRHVTWQLEHLTRPEAAADVRERLDAECVEGLRLRLVREFVEPMRTAASRNVEVLQTLASRGLQMGVISNACGNVHLICEDLGYAPYFSVIVDSRRVGLFKPDPAIYSYAVAKMGIPADESLMVGDSFERDVLPARAIGMKTVWLEDGTGRACPDRALVDDVVKSIADLPAIIPLPVAEIA